MIQNNKKLNFKDPAYIEPFFVGLLEGDGTIIVMRNRNLSRPSFKISLKYNIENLSMLEQVRKSIGGRVHYINNKRGNAQISWAASAKKDVSNILNILEKYPLLSSRKICQLEYAKQCLENLSVQYLLQTRDNKYDNQQKLVKQYNKGFNIPHYFGPWLSGFIEAEGCFSSTTDLKLMIGQNHDWYLINAIKNYFKSHHKIILHKDLRPNSCQQHYYIVMGGLNILKHIVAHIEENPLLGYKQVSYDIFYKKFINLRTVPKLPFIDPQEQHIQNLARKIQKSFANLDDYLVPYFVGFFEGTGNINIVKGRQLSGPYLYITLTHNLENESLLRLISCHIGGNVNVKSAQSQYTSNMGCN